MIIPATLPCVTLEVQIRKRTMMKRKRTDLEPDYDKSMAIAGWLVISLVLWGVLLLVLI